MARKIYFGLVLTLVFSVSLAWAAENPAPAEPPQTVLTLEKCLELAYANNQSLKAAQQSVVIAQANVKKAEGGFLPSLGYQVGIIKSKDPTTSLGPEPTTLQFRNTDGQVVYTSDPFLAVKPYEGPDPVYSGSLSATYPIYTGGKLQSALKLAKYQLDLAKEKEHNVKQNLTYTVKATYNNVWLAEEYLLVAKASYENMARHAERIEKLYQVGNTSKFELLRAQVNRDNLKPAVIKAQNGVAVAQLALATLIGLPKDIRVAIAFEPDKVQLPESPGNKLDTVLTMAYANRSELKQLRLTTQMSEVQVKLAESYLKPDVALTGAYNRAGDDLAMDLSKTWTLTLGVQGSLYKGTNKPAITAAKADLELLKIQESSLRDSIRQEVDQVLHSITENYETAKSTQASIVLAKESLRLTEVRFQAGMATTMDVLDAQLALDKALTGYYESLASYLTAQAKLDLVTGKN